ncbi:unnamed protein product [Rotaria socialis]|uniref:Uncharacterized protein n=1 Tax=Rotaria socialis TaxID=392032 RepID=A0A820BXT2_9BILA|nr:unnamed protein product [Rotaria socialis]CAF3697214.1 unnamed protein product [Rotaria socialis]CAF4214757.1 unnamed protein product [Rotaria socialis]
MFNSSYGSSRIIPLSRSTSFEYFDDQDLSALQFRMFIGVLISFSIIICLVISAIIYYELFTGSKNQLTEEHAIRLKDFKELTGMHIELNDIQSILMNEFILQAWKREKYRRERHI